MEMITLLRSESWFDQQQQHMWEGMHTSTMGTEHPRSVRDYMRALLAKQKILKPKFHLLYC